MFNIKLGIPGVEQYWSSLKYKIDNKQANRTDEIKYKKLGNTFKNYLKIQNIQALFTRN